MVNTAEFAEAIASVHETSRTSISAVADVAGRDLRRENEHGVSGFPAIRRQPSTDLSVAKTSRHLQFLISTWG